jgi:hypothetical protein
MIQRLRVFWRKRKAMTIIVAALALSSIAAFGFTRFTGHPPAGPTFEVKRGTSGTPVGFCRWRFWLPISPRPFSTAAMTPLSEIAL